MNAWINPLLCTKTHTKLSNTDPDMCHHMVPPDYNELTLSLATFCTLVFLTLILAIYIFFHRLRCWTCYFSLPVWNKNKGFRNDTGWYNWFLSNLTVLLTHCIISNSLYRIHLVAWGLAVKLFRWMSQNLINEKSVLVSGNGLVPSGNTLPEPMLTQIYVAILCHLAAMR